MPPTLPEDEQERREQVARRIRAVQALAGYSSVERMAEVTAGRGVGLARLREIYQQRGDPPRAVELREVAEACEIPYGIFVLDLETALDEHAGELYDDVAQLRARIEQNERVFREEIASLGERLLVVTHEHGGGGKSFEQVAIDEGRGLTQSPVDLLGNDARDGARRWRHS